MTQERLEELIRAVYRRWKEAQGPAQDPHPDEEAWVSFLEGKLGAKDEARVKKHLVACQGCSEVLAVLARLRQVPGETPPKALIEYAKSLVAAQDINSAAQIVIMLKEKAMEVLSITGDILIGREFIPAPVLRSRRIKEFKDEITVLKDFKDIRVEVRIERKGAHLFDMFVYVKDKQANRVIRDLRVTLLKDDLELESYLTSSDKVTFEHVLAGKYNIEISNIDDKIASVLLDIRK